MSQLIPNEIPKWTIDWANKVFTFLNDIDYITQLTFDWAEYTSFVVDSVNKKQVTLTDAPIVSIYADYYVATVIASWSDECTFWDIKSKVWALMGQTSNSTNFSNTIVWDEINLRGREIWKGRVVNKLNPRQIYRAWNTDYRNATSNIRIKAWSILTAVFNLWDTEALMDTTNVLWAWYMEIGGDIIKYTSIISTQIEWTSGQTIDHLVWEKAIQLYELPANIDKPTEVFVICKGQEARKKPIPLDMEEQFNIWYKVIKSNWKTLLKINGLQNDDLVTVKYVTKFTNMDDNSNECPFPEDYWIRVLAYIVAGTLWYDKGLLNSEQHLNGWYGALNEMYGDFNDITNVIKQKIRPQAYSFSSLRRY